MKYVIIGNSTAAIGCVEGIRAVDKQSPITLISSEKYHTYSRPLISYLLLGKTDNERMKYRADDFYEKNGVKTMFGTTVTSIEKSKKLVVLENGTAVPYDKLMVATGSRPFVPPIEGLANVENKYTFMSLDDAISLDAAIDNQTDVLIMGAGLIGLKCAEGILSKVKNITVVDMADHILPSILNADAAKIVQNHLEKLGVKFILGDAAAKFTENSAKLSSGKTVYFDILVVAVGVRANTQLVGDAGGEVNRGIVTDNTSKTTLDDIYAAGDNSESYDITIGSRRVLALLPNAYMQGECAGENMAGAQKSFDTAMPMNAIGFLGLHIITAGTYDGEVYLKADDKNYKALFYKDNLLKGYILIGDVARAGIYTSLIRNKTPLDTIDFSLICEKPQMMAFTSRMELMNK